MLCLRPSESEPSFDSLSGRDEYESSSSIFLLLQHGDATTAVLAQYSA